MAAAFVVFAVFLDGTAVASTRGIIETLRELLGGVTLNPLSRLAVISAAILFMAASGLGIGYAFWVGALLLGILQGMGLEEIVNYLSEGAQREGSLHAAVVLVAGAVLSAALLRRRIPARLAAWVARRLGTGGGPAFPGEMFPALLPRPGGEWHFAGEGLHGRRPAGTGPWIEPSARLLWPWAPVFLVSCVLFRLPAGPAWLLFLSLMVISVVAAAWTCPEPKDGSFSSCSGETGSPEGILWALLPVAALPWGLQGLAIASIASAFVNVLRLEGTFRTRMGFVWNAVTIDLVVLVAGVVAYGAMLEGGRAGETFLPVLEERGLLGPWGMPVAFAAATGFAACGGALTGVGLLVPVVLALSSGGIFSPPWLAAIIGGALSGELVRMILWSGVTERGGWLRTAGVLVLVAAASLFPGLLNTR